MVHTKCCVNLNRLICNAKRLFIDDSLIAMLLLTLALRLRLRWFRLGWLYYSCWSLDGVYIVYFCEGSGSTW
jgi:hypothetical protein